MDGFGADFADEVTRSIIIVLSGYEKRHGSDAIVTNRTLRSENDHVRSRWRPE